MSDTIAAFRSPIVQTTRQLSPRLSAIVGGMAGAVGWAAMAVFMLFAWPYQGQSYSPEAAIFYPMIFPIFGLVTGLILGLAIGWLSALASRAVGSRAPDAQAGVLVGACIGAAIGAISAAGMLLWAQRNADGILASMLLHVGFLKRSLPVQLITGLVPGLACGLIGARHQTTTSAGCPACGGFVRSDATRCKHCGVAFAPDREPARVWSQRNLVRLGAGVGLLLGVAGVVLWLQSRSTVAVPGLDNRTLELGKVQGMRTKAEITAALGAPPLVYTGAGRASQDWAYPIRVDGWSNERATPAAMLEIALDASGKVVSWGFFDSASHAQLPIRESAAQANEWLDNRDIRPADRIDLAAALKPGLAKKQVLALLVGPSNNLPFFYPEELETIFTRPAATGEGEVLRFYVDRPSPLLIPPFLYVRVFDEGESSSYGYFSGY